MKKLLLLFFSLMQLSISAQTNMPISTSNIVQHSSNGTFATLFRYKVRKWNGDTTSKFAWLNTDATGLIVDTRSHVLNGKFSSGTTALSNVPVGYGTVIVPDDFESSKQIGYNCDFPEEDFTRAKSEYLAASQNGATYIMINIKWNSNSPLSSVFANYSQQTANSATNWQYYDSLIDYAAGLTTTTGAKMKVSIRFVAAIDDGTHYDLFGSTNTSGFVGLSNMALDHLGYPSRVAEGIGQISLSNTTAVSQALDFVSKGLARYIPRLRAAGSDLLWYSVGTAAQWETGYGYENQHYATISDTNPTPRYQTSYDYSTPNIAAFRTYVQAQTKYNTLAKLNTAWGTSYTNYNQIDPPHGDNNGIYASAIGTEWWLFNLAKVKEFQTSCKAFASSYSPAPKYTLEWGSTTDVLSPRRMSIDILDMPNYSDMMKAQFGRISNNDNLSISMDNIRTNYSKKIGTELNTQDFLTQGGATTSQEIKTQMVYMGQGAVENGANDLLFISSKRNPDYFNVTMEAMPLLKSYLNSNGGARQTAATTVNYNLADIIQNYNGWLQTWVSAGGSNSRRINFVQAPTIVIPSGSSCINPLTLYDNHQFCLSTTNIKSQDYYNAGEGSTLQNDYNNTRFRLWAATHSITYANGSVNGTNFITSDLAKSNWSIKGTMDNIVYVSNTQSSGYFSNQNGSNTKENNHPARFYLPSLIDDSIFYIPIASQDFIVTMTNTGSVNLSFTVDQLDPSVLLHRKKLAPGATDTFTINMASVGKSSIKQIKVNCNRDNNTDSLPNVN